MKNSVGLGIARARELQSELDRLLELVEFQQRQIDDVYRQIEQYVPDFQTTSLLGLSKNRSKHLPKDASDANFTMTPLHFITPKLLPKHLWPSR